MLSFFFPLLPLGFPTGVAPRGSSAARSVASVGGARMIMPTRKPVAAVARRGGSRPSQVLGQRALNRAMLERQLLLRRSKLPVLKAVEHLVGLQAQAPNAPYYGLWTRLQGFRQEDLSALLIDRQVVRLVLMRGTLHLATGRDARMLRPLVQPMLERVLKTGSAHARKLTGLDLEALVAAGRAHVDEQPLTYTELGARLAERWPDRAPTALAQAIRLLAPLIQVPPRGVWGSAGQARCTTIESWLGQPLDATPSVDEMVLRYLAAFGPASVMDVQAWSGLTRLGEVVERLRPGLRTFRDEQGRELFDVPDAPRPDPETPAPVRFLPEFDNLLLSHADRTRVISDEDRKRTITPNGLVPGSLLVDGFFRGTWKLQQGRGTATLLIEPFKRLSPREREEVTDEGEKLLTFAAADASRRDLQFIRPK
ncbi:winged helix DNA-binding domain-containing protein [Pyxidicoccus sp. MSG2]|uniref:winged helix DNA-binding domain-containing protein n=1 Tax=Pyxidicoccus sp. MSG2 TaxID=2996790 RepID=UPI00227054D6|nr:winged helix DNA-binding domain-containing protein [Pyxidicoccus sp. MSG2]MCY1020885.1 winged helix DNA-binding domain-containing protein [Pyxidicoccus sp. MSG2]